MSADSRSHAEFRETTRAPLQAPATIQIDAFSEPLTGYTANVSRGGLFVQMEDLPPVGAIVKFQIDLGSPPSSVRGTADVVWIRTQAQGPQRPAGIGLQFRFVEGNGEPLLQAAVEKALEQLGPEPEPPPPVKRKQRPPRPPASEPLTPRDKKKPENKDKKKKVTAKKQKPADDTKQILGMPAEKAKLILLLILMAFFLLIFLL